MSVESEVEAAMSHYNETSALLSHGTFEERGNRRRNASNQVNNHMVTNKQKDDVSEVRSDAGLEAAGREAIAAEVCETDQTARKRVMWALPALAVGVFLAAADQTVVVSSYGKIGSEMHSLNNTSWIATG